MNIGMIDTHQRTFAAGFGRFVGSAPTTNTFWNGCRAEAPGHAWWRRLLLAGSVALAACAPAEEFNRAAGRTMGTEYLATWSGGTQCTAALSQPLAAELQSVNRQMSTYLPDSELMRFNRGPAHRWTPVSQELAGVVTLALELSRLSGGAFDVTVGPLVNLWGFGAEQRGGLPTAGEVERARHRVGHGLLEVRRAPSALRKRRADLYVDLSAIAKGHGVDRLAGVLEKHGCGNYLVDIGGEVRVRGLSPAGGRWRIGIETPEAGGAGGVERVLLLSEGAVATSGDYRNFRLVEGTRLGHTIDPRTGRPVAHGMASVTVVADSAALADGLATLINVLGPDDGLQFANDRRLAALALIRRQGVLEQRYTDAMRDYIENGP